MEKRVISTQVMQEDIPVEAALRPKTLDEYVGQEKAKENLRVYKEGGEKERRGAGSCALLRTSRTGEDDAGGHYCQ